VIDRSNGVAARVLRGVTERVNDFETAGFGI